jgi:hypothetical protein
LLQAETREAQEAHLFSLYNAALLSLADGQHEAAGRSLREIAASPLFHKENNEEPLAKALRYNVHKVSHTPYVGQCFGSALTLCGSGSIFKMNGGPALKMSADPGPCNVKIQKTKQGKIKNVTDNKVTFTHF